VYRDLEQLRAAGVPVAFDPATRQYRIDGRFFMPPVQLDLEESLALAALCADVAGRDQIPFLGPAERALHKLVAQLPQPLRAELAERSGNLVIRTARSMPPDGHGDVYGRVRQAMASGRALRCKYEPVNSAKDEPAGEFDFQPYALFFAVRAWYAVGRRSDRDGALRCLKLSRFTKIVPGTARYSIPRDFSIDRYLGNAWRMIPGEGEHQVEIRFDPSFAETMADTLWHPTQEIEWHRDGSCTFRCTVSGLDEILWWVLSMGPHCVVKRPAALAARVRAAAREVVARYRSRPSRRR
jgi:predicted DNA-binding transcriptional regulator YafY